MDNLVKLREQVSYIKNLPEDWDDEGAEKFNPNIVDNAFRIAVELGFVEYCKISPCRDGSVDVHWKKWRDKQRLNGFECLLNVGEEGISYYAEQGDGYEYKLGPFKLGPFSLGPLVRRDESGSSIKVTNMTPFNIRFRPVDSFSQTMPDLYRYMRKWWPYSLKEKIVRWYNRNFSKEWYLY